MGSMCRLSVVLGTILLLVGTAAGQVTEGNDRVAKEPPGPENPPGASVVGIDELVAGDACVQACLHENQMAAVGVEVLLAQCHESCRVDRALELVKSTDPERYREGVLILCDTTDPRAAAPLVEALRRDLRERTGLWASIIPALGALRVDGAVPLLIGTLNDLDEDWLGREASARALGEIGNPAAIPALTAAVYRADTRADAIRALAGFHDARVVEPLLEALQEGEEREVREAALAGLRDLGTLAVPALLEAFGEYNPEYPETARRVEICTLLGESGDPGALDRLRAARSDPDPAVARCALKFTGGGRGR